MGKKERRCANESAAHLFVAEWVRHGAVGQGKIALPRRAVDD